MVSYLIYLSNVCVIYSYVYLLYYKIKFLYILLKIKHGYNKIFNKRACEIYEKKKYL